MPVEIKELHIRVAVDASPSGPAPAVQTAAVKAPAGGDKDAIVAECVEQVLQIIQSRRER
jgi:hypothetical protein